MPQASVGSSTALGRVASARRLALRVAFASFSVLFAAALVGFFVTRAQSQLWRAADMPALPLGMWLSSGLVLAISASFQSALSAVRSNRSLALERRLWLGTGFLALFLLVQAHNWSSMLHGIQDVRVRTLYPYTFFLLTGLHAAHVLGGVVPLGFVLQRSHRRDYSSSHHEGLALLADYWHFLGAVWLVLFAALELSA